MTGLALLRLAAEAELKPADLRAYLRSEIERRRAERHLTVAQRAALALDLLPKLEEEARERQRAAGGGTGRAGGDSRTLSPETDEAFRSDEKAAALVGVGRSTVGAERHRWGALPLGEESPDA